MSLKTFLSFSGGELNPILHDNVTLDKFNKALATARNVIIGKTASIISRFATANFIKSKNNSEAIVCYSPPNSGILTEWGPSYVRVYGFDGVLDFEASHSYTASQIQQIHFVSTGPFIYTFVKGETPARLRYEGSGSAFDPVLVVFGVPDAPDNMTITANGTPTGYAADYQVTMVFNGQETLPVEIGSGYSVPIAAGQSNTIDVRISSLTSVVNSFNEIRVYRRPHLGGSYGFIGSSTLSYISGTDLRAAFEDLGGNADFTNNPPDTISKLGFSGVEIYDLNPKTGAVYQQRLLLGNINSAYIDEEAIIASRPGYLNNFHRDYPYDADSALKFKSGTTGRASVLRIVDSDGLVIFTSVGVYVNLGVLSIDNVSLVKRGSWVIKDTLAPLEVPGGLFFVDTSNVIRQLIYSQDILSYQAIDHTIFSEHLFQEKTINSWAFQNGVVPIIIVTFTDGTWATFNYSYEHQMRAWTRHDSAYPVEQVVSTGVPDSTFFVVNKNGNRYIDVSLPRFIPSDTYESNPEADKINLNAFMDSVKTQSTLINDSLSGSDILVLTPITSGVWDGSLTLTCGTSGLFPDPGLGEIGTIFRHFNTVDKTSVDLTVTARASDDSVTVLPSCEFPSDQASGFRLYETFTQVTGLSHLEGENVGILLDGFVANSPNNDVDGYTPVTVSSGTITLPDGLIGAIAVVGRPITADIKTLNINTVEQSPTTVESINVNKLYIKMFKSRGIYVSNRFPEEETGDVDGSSVKGMEDLDDFIVPDGYDLVGNRYKQPITRRAEVLTTGDWDSQGQISIRQVDPVHFEIISIIPDLEVLRRSNRS